MTRGDIQKLLDKYPVRPVRGNLSTADAANWSRKYVELALELDKERGEHWRGWVYGVLPLGKRYVEVRPEPAGPHHKATKKQVDALLNWGSWDLRVEEEVLALLT